MRVVSLNVGRPRLVVHEGRQYSTAMNRTPVGGPLWLSRDGFEGDKVADTRYHGGPEQAACVYAQENYARVGGFLATVLPMPSFGENLTTLGLTDDSAAIGDTLRIGSAVVQISKPRQPCVKLARQHNRPDLVEWIIAHCASGYYIRVLEEGQVTSGDAIELLERRHPDLTVAQCIRAMFHPEAPAALRPAFAACELLSPNWRQKMGRSA